MEAWILQGRVLRIRHRYTNYLHHMTGEKAALDAMHHSRHLQLGELFRDSKNTRKLKEFIIEDLKPAIKSKIEEKLITDVNHAVSDVKTPGKAKPTTKQNSKVVLAKELLSLKQTEEELDKEISELSSDYSEEELQVHIDLLHEYNEIKDVGQLLLGRLAQIEGTTTKELYQRFDLDIED